jgi:hypothetical protein
VTLARRRLWLYPLLALAIAFAISLLMDRQAEGPTRPEAKSAPVWQDPRGIEMEMRSPSTRSARSGPEAGAPEAGSPSTTSPPAGGKPSR